MQSLENSLYVKLVAFDKATLSYSLQSGFNSNTAYWVIGMYDAYLSISNDYDEMRFISNRHAQNMAILPEQTAFRLALTHINSVH